MVTPEMYSMYKNYIQSKEWFDMKIDLLQIRGCKCEICQIAKSPCKIQMHHITYKNLYNESPNELMLLCNKCHMKIHGLIKKKKVKKNKVKRKKHLKRKANDTYSNGLPRYRGK